MQDLMITKIKDYLVVKIPLRAFKGKRVSFSANEERAVAEGLQAVEDGRVSKIFKTSKQAVEFLRNL